jgi:hypothetical protein
MSKTELGCLFSGLEVKPKALCMLGKDFTTKQSPDPELGHM